MIKWKWSGPMLAMLVATIAQAQTPIDVAAISCDQFLVTTVASPDDIAIWLSGYYNGRRNNTVIDVQQLKDHAQKVKSHCLYSGKGQKLMEVVEKLLPTSK